MRSLNSAIVGFILQKIFLYSFIMMLGVELVFFLANLFLEPTKLGYLIIIILGVTVGILIYGTITIKRVLRTNS